MPCYEIDLSGSWWDENYRPVVFFTGTNEVEFYPVSYEKRILLNLS